MQSKPCIQCGEIGAHMRGCGQIGEHRDDGPLWMGAVFDEQGRQRVLTDERAGYGQSKGSPE